MTFQLELRPILLTAFCLNVPPAEAAGSSPAAWHSPWHRTGVWQGLSGVAAHQTSGPQLAHHFRLAVSHHRKESLSRDTRLNARRSTRCWLQWR